MTTPLDLKTLVYLAAEEIKNRLTILIPEMEVGINSLSHGVYNEDPTTPIFYASCIRRESYPEVCLVDPNDRYLPRSGCECKFVPVFARCEPWTGLVKVHTGRVRDGGGARSRLTPVDTMHVENPMVFDWAVEQFMRIYKEFRNG